MKGVGASTILNCLFRPERFAIFIEEMPNRQSDNFEQGEAIGWQASKDERAFDEAYIKRVTELMSKVRLDEVVQSPPNSRAEQHVEPVLVLFVKTEKTEHEMIKMKGFVIIINHRPGAQTVLVESYINHGMVDEEQANMGISHLLEHICTDGWKKCKKNCSTHWKKRGAVMNASTGQTYVNYYIHGLN